MPRGRQILAAISFATALTAHSTDPSGVRSKLETLGRARMAFQDKVIEHLGQRDVGMDDNIYSMGPGEQRVIGYYPLGHSDRRFLVFTLNGWKSVLCQRVQYLRVTLVWRVRLRKSVGKSNLNGTLSRILQRHGVEPFGRISTQARKDLNDRMRLAGYGYDGDGGLSAWTVHADGSLGPSYYCGEPTDHSFFPIVPEEAAALGFGSQGWPQTMKFTPEPMQVSGAPKIGWRAGSGVGVGSLPGLRRRPSS